MSPSFVVIACEISVALGETPAVVQPEASGLSWYQSDVDLKPTPRENEDERPFEITVNGRHTENHGRRGEGSRTLPTRER
jgi:hypothetical protein